MIVNATWRMEGLQTILWTLGLVNHLPPYDQQASDDLLKLFDLEQFESFVASAKIREFNALEKERSLAEPPI